MMFLNGGEIVVEGSGEMFFESVRVIIINFFSDGSWIIVFV